MRSKLDRLRHALGFEIIGLLLVTPLGMWAFGLPLHSSGIVGAVSAGIATAWNYLYNLLFDHAMLRLAGHVKKTVPVRLLHAVLFEAGLLLLLVPFIAWYLQTTWMHAFAIDLSFALFYLVYAFVFNWLYDVVFPVPDLKLPDGSPAP